MYILFLKRWERKKPRHIEYIKRNNPNSERRRYWKTEGMFVSKYEITTLLSLKSINILTVYQKFGF